nr:hypothetical protein [Pseudomonas sp. 10-1B]
MTSPSDDSHLNADMLAVWGLFNSRKNDDGTPGGSTWREGFNQVGGNGTNVYSQLTVAVPF